MITEETADLLRELLRRAVAQELDARAFWVLHDMIVKLENRVAALEAQGKRLDGGPVEYLSDEARQMCERCKAEQ